MRHVDGFKNVAEIIAESPMIRDRLSAYAMPFGALWQEHSRMDDDGGPAGNYLGKGTVNRGLFDTCFAIQRRLPRSLSRWPRG